MVRTTSNWASEESFRIYRGEGTSGQLVYTQPTISTATTNTYTVCLMNTLHTILMTDTYGDGWSSGSKVVLSYLGDEIGTFTLPSGTTGTQTFSIGFYVNEEAAWRYSNTPETSTSWTTGTCTWQETASYPAVSTMTRYFRYTITPPANSGFFGIRIKITTNTGFRCYVNGQKMYDWNMPTGTITADTPATSSVATATKRGFSALLGQFPSQAGGDIIIAVEMHATSTTVSGAEPFKAIIKLLNSPQRVIDGTGTTASNPTVWNSNESPSMLWDGTTATKWCCNVVASNFPVWSSYMFANGDRELVNRYEVSTANDYPVRDCVSWNLYGTMDGTTWYAVDKQEDVVWTARKQTKVFELQNFISFSGYKFECLEIQSISDGCYQMSDVNLLLTDKTYQQPGITYPVSSVTLASNLDTVSLKPNVIGYHTFSITGAGGATLPDGLVFNQNTGLISGTPTTSLATTSFTISAVYLGDGQTYTTTISLTVTNCVLPSYMPVTITKTQYSLETEAWTLKNSAGETVMVSDTSKTTVGSCLPVGDYTLTMTHSSGQAWNAESLVTISSIINSRTIVLGKARLNELSTETITLSFQYPLGPVGVSTVKYLNDGTVPENWYTSSFVDTNWQTLDASNRPSSTQKIKLYRTTFNVASKTNYQGFELSFFSRAGVLIYLNGNEIYRRYLSSGAISSSSTATGGGTSSTWKLVTGSMDSIIQGSNTLAFAIITLGEDPLQLDFDAMLRLLTDSHKTPRYWGFTSTGDDSEKLFDYNPSTRMWAGVQPSGNKIVLSFGGDRAELFNKYCFITNWDTPKSDPREWTVSGSNDGTTFTEIKSETDAYFDIRSNSYCFYMPSNTVAYTHYELAITKTRETASQVSLVAWNLYLQDFTSLVVPELSFTPNELVGYTGSAFPSAVCSSEYYNTFSISPALPDGLTINSNNGVIRGIMNNQLNPTVYTITALNHLGETKTTTITLSVEICSGDKVAFTLEFQMESGATSCSYQLIDQSNMQVVSSRTSFINYYTLSIPMCEHATTYKIKLSKTDTTGWGSNKVIVKLADGTPLLSESLAAGVTSKEYPFNPAYSVLPQWTEWNYLVDGTAAPAGWNTVDGAPVSWTSATPTHFPTATGVTQYYYKKFDVSSLSAFSSLDIAVNVKAGAIVYLNGHELRRINMPEGEITVSTAATTDYPSPSLIITGEWLNNNILVEGTNILAVELHRLSVNEEQNSFDGSLILILNNMYMMIDGSGITEPAKEGDEGSDKVFDNNSSTKFLSETENGCVGISLIWQYNNERREPIANYGLVNGNDCNTRSPSGWRFFGSNDGEKWTILQERAGQHFTAYFDQIRTDVYNSKAYSLYKVTSTECTNPALNGQEGASHCGAAQRFQLADYYLFSKRIEAGTYCEALDNYSPAIYGDSSYIDCPTYYDGWKVRTCENGKFSDEISLCTAAAPKAVVFAETSITLYQNKQITPITPRIEAAEYTVAVFPQLPAGLTLDTKTGTISGAPTTLQEMKLYSIYVSNHGGKLVVDLNIAVVEAPVNWVLIVIIAVVVIILIVIIVFVVIAVKKKKSKNAPVVKKPSSKVSKKNSMPKVVKKASIKV